MWMIYSAMHNSGDFNEPYKANPPGGRYGMTMQEFELVIKK
jgi:hypothetical protein